MTRQVESRPLPAPQPPRPGLQTRQGGPPSAAPPASRILVDWPINTCTGWGIFGLNLTLQLLRQGRLSPALLMTPELGAASPIAQALLHNAVRDQQEIGEYLKDHGVTVDCDFPILRGLGHDLKPHATSERVRGSRNVGVAFLEDTRLLPEAIKWGEAYDLLIAGSSWNRDLLQQYGLPNVRLVQQGIDPSVFHPGPRSGLLTKRFVIFSGGKLEYRKGQDLVVAAFRRFHMRHSEALLVAAWHNEWPDSMAGIDRMGHVMGRPAVENGRLKLGEWLVHNGLLPGTFVEIGPQPNWAMAPILRDADLALFPNRCEGGTNLVAMEAMATGVPTILSANSGHLDLIQSEHCYPLLRQKSVVGCELFSGYEGWGESDVDEMVELMEQAYRQRDAAQAKGIKAAEFMQREWSWERQVERLTEEIVKVL
jgi:glycosyltransferase involved in cell wall biosynthesis